MFYQGLSYDQPEASRRTAAVWLIRHRRARTNLRASVDPGPGAAKPEAGPRFHSDDTNASERDFLTARQTLHSASIGTSETPSIPPRFLDAGLRGFSGRPEL